MGFKAINWSPNELVGENKMDQMSENSTWLFKNTPRAVYTLPGGLRRTEGIRIASGRVMIARSDSDQATAMVRFGNFFSARCEPIITTGIVSDPMRKIFAVHNGIGQLQPDHRGFQVAVNIDASLKVNDKIARSFFITWQAIGY